MSSSSLWTLSAAATLLWGMCWSTPGRLESYCESEIFKADCGPYRVVVKVTARYGRMNIGRCVKTDYGYIGCEANVIGIADRYCSGRRSCEIPISNTLMSRMNKCNKDLHVYLLTEYRCVDVVNNRSASCHSQQDLPLTLNEQIIANVITMETGCGGSQSPWVIEGRPGQTINVTLADFSLGFNNTKCHSYATLTEIDGKTEHVCLGRGRERHVYTTISHRLQVVIRDQEHLPVAEQSMFLIKYVGNSVAIIKAPGFVVLLVVGSIDFLIRLSY